MKLVYVRVFRELYGIRSRLLTIILALATSMAVPCGLEMALDSLVASRDRFTSELNLADLEVRMIPEDIRNLPDWSDIPGLQSVETRLLLPGTLDLGEGTDIAAVNIFLSSSSPRINQLKLLEGSTFTDTKSSAAVAERTLSTYHGVKPGQVLKVRVGDKVYEHEISGIVSSSEFFIVAANPEYLLPEKGSLAVVYTSLDRIYESLGFVMVNDLLFHYQPGHDPAKIKEAILSKLEGRLLERVIEKEQHLSRRHIILDRDVFKIFEPAISLVLGLMAFALVIINMDRILRHRQRELGVLLALGYTPKQVLASYLIAALGLALLGMVLGTAGAVGFREAFLGIYSEAHGLAYLEKHTPPRVLALGWVAVALIAVTSTFLATLRLWGATPLSLLRPPVVLVTSIGRFTQFLYRQLEGSPLGVRVGIRNVFRNLRLTATTIAAVTLALSVGIAYLVCLRSMSTAIVTSFEGQQWERAISFLYPALDDDYAHLKSNQDIRSVEPFIRVQGRLQNAQLEMDTSVLGIVKESMRNPHISAGRVARAPGEIVVGEDLARKLGLRIGDPATLVLRNQNLTVTLVGTKADVMLGESLADLEWLREVLELEEQATGIFIATRPGVDLLKLDEELKQMEFAGRITAKENLVRDFETVLQDIRKLVMLVAIIALTVAMLFVVANLSMTIAERLGEFASLRILGFDNRTSRAIILTEGLLQMVVALMLVAPASLVMAVYLNGLASEAWFTQATDYPAWMFAAVSVCVVALTPVSLLSVLKRVREMNPIQEIKSRNIE